MLSWAEEGVVIEEVGSRTLGMLPQDGGGTDSTFLARRTIGARPTDDVAKLEDKDAQFGSMGKFLGC